LQQGVDVDQVRVALRQVGGEQPSLTPIMGGKAMAPVALPGLSHASLQGEKAERTVLLPHGQEGLWTTLRPVHRPAEGKILEVFGRPNAVVEILEVNVEIRPEQPERLGWAKRVVGPALQMLWTYHSGET